MDVLNRESFDLRADLFGRTIEGELVMSLNGPRSQEAHARLAQISERRKVRIAELVRRVQSERWWDRTSDAPSDRYLLTPRRIYMIEECPICNDSEPHCALACGHVVCGVCHSQLCRQGSCACPQCRRVSEHVWSISELSSLPDTIWVS